MSIQQKPTPINTYEDADCEQELNEIASLLLSVSRMSDLSTAVTHDSPTASRDGFASDAAQSKSSCFTPTLLVPNVESRHEHVKHTPKAVSTSPDVLFANCFTRNELETLIRSKRTSPLQAPSHLLKDDSPVPHSKTFLRSQWQYLDVVVHDGHEYLVRLTAPESGVTVATRTQRSDSACSTMSDLTEAPVPLVVAASKAKCRVLVPKEDVEKWLCDACVYWQKVYLLPSSVRTVSELCASVFWMGKGRGQLPWDSAHTYLQHSGNLEPAIKSNSGVSGWHAAAKQHFQQTHHVARLDVTPPRPPSLVAPSPSSLPSYGTTMLGCSPAAAFAMHPHHHRMPVPVRFPHMVLVNTKQQHAFPTPPAVVSGVKRAFEGERSYPMEPRRLFREFDE